MFSLHQQSPPEYLAYYNKCIDLIQFDVVQAILSDDYKLEAMDELKNSEGVINKIFILKIKDQNDRLLLRISNPHNFWQNYAKDNHIYCHSLMQLNNIPVSKVFKHGKYGGDQVYFEYIIFILEEGLITLGAYLDNITEQENEQINICQIFLNQGLDVVQKLQSIKVPQQIGSFDINGAMVGIVNDGPRLGPFSSYKQLLIDQIRWSVDEFNYINSNIPSIGNQLNEIELFENFGYISQDIIDKLIRIEKLLMDQVEVHRQQYFLCHNDLNPSNIMINPKTLEIKAIIDLDQCTISPYTIDPLSPINGWTTPIAKIQLNDWYLNQIKIKCIQYGYEEYQFIQEIVDHAKWACFWVNTWFRAYSEEQIPQMVINERKRELNDLNRLLDKFFFTDQF